MSENTTPQPGDQVIAWYHAEPVTYGGPDERAPHTSYTRTKFDLRDSTSTTTAFSPVERVAPADTPLADPKDPRMSISKYTSKPVGAAGPWSLTLNHPGITDDAPTFHKTKRDAVISGRVRLAILDARVTS
jgi:hypothetical protein